MTGAHRFTGRPARPAFVVETAGLGRRHGTVDALVGVDLQVTAGTVLAVLGHNGAGKTTLIDLLSTRIRPTRGTARICGIDVMDDPAGVRTRIGVVTQFGSLDGKISARDNLVLVGRLLGAGREEARGRADELLEAFDLVEAAARPVDTFSGGMRRRLDLAAGLLGAPDVLFLDEPTTGLDPVSRAAVWEIVTDLVRAGTAVILTTQYLEEADRLANDIVVLGRGSVIATGTPAMLKARLGSRTATVTVLDPRLQPVAVDELRRSGMAASGVDRTVAVPIEAPGDVARVVRILDHARIALTDLAVAEPTLDGVYLALHRSGGWA